MVGGPYGLPYVTVMSVDKNITSSFSILMKTLFISAYFVFKYFFLLFHDFASFNNLHHTVAEKKKRKKKKKKKKETNEME